MTTSGSRLDAREVVVVGVASKRRKEPPPLAFGREGGGGAGNRVETNHLRLAFACEGGGGGGSLGVTGVSGRVKEEGTEENGQRQMSLPVFATHCLGLPLHGSPLAFLHPQLPVV
jgi:hypothetical protein